MLPVQLQSLYSFPQQIIFEKHVNSHEAEGWARYVPGWPAADETQSAKPGQQTISTDTSDALSSQMSLRYDIQKELIWIFLVVLRRLSFFVIHILNSFSVSESWEISEKKPGENVKCVFDFAVIALSLS